ncbi:MAG TPA: argininosuccinate lyase [Vicinamibacterales bacterium]|nr:argininosuccinate lyase [Vicinamibacterales bacterium]
MTFAPEYVRFVLSGHFEDAKERFLPSLMAVHYAHLVMLAGRGIVSREEAAAIRDALSRISVADVRTARYDGSCEDLFFYVERLLAESCGDETAGRLHTARSRNDIDMTMYRMQQRELILALTDGVLRLRGVLLDLSDRHRHTLLAVLTHTQPAQPTTLAHYLLAVVEQLERDTTRLKAAYAATNRNPLGACAVTGTGFPIDRGRTTELLGFEEPTGNTYGSIATVDYLLESVSAAAVLLVGLGRVVQDLLLWCTSEFGYLRLADGFVQCSSIMPQKRNPVALEHARAICSTTLGQAGAIHLAVHNTPFGDIVDTEDDLQPLVFRMFDDAARAVNLVSAALSTAAIDGERMAAGAKRGWIAVTELADSLTREHGVPFKASHRVAARFVQSIERRPGAPLGEVLREAAAAVLGRPIDYEDAAVAELLSPEHFVGVRTTHGGPAPSETARAMAASRALQDVDAAWLAGATGRLRDAEAKLRAAAAAL